MSARRADAYLVAQGFFPSRAQAHAAILAGDVRVDGQVLHKPGTSLADTALVEVAERPRFVSRGGEKLDLAIEAFGIEVEGLRGLDAGASTGGFTDCLLSRGCREVVAVDVGYGQFSWKLRTDARVRLMERTNVRSLTVEATDGPCDLAVGDLSFISLRLVVPALVGLVEPGGPLLMLFKPQFEAGKGRVGKGGVIRDPALHVELLADFAAWADLAGLGPRGLVASAPRGADGNLEFWWWLAAASPRTVDDGTVARVVAAQHGEGA